MPLLTNEADKELRVRIKSTASTSPKHQGGSLSTELKTELEGIELSASARLRSPGGQLAKYGCCMPLPPPSNSNRREGRGGNGISFLPPCLLLTPTCPLPSDLLYQLPYYLNLIASAFVLLFPIVQLTPDLD